MGVVVILNFFLRDLNSRRDLVADHLLRHNLVADTGFKVLKGNTLLLRLLFEIIHAFQLELLAQLVEALRQLSIARDAEVLALAE